MFSEVPFSAYGWSHGLAVLSIAVVGALLFRWIKLPSVSDHVGLRKGLAVLLVYSVLSGMIDVLLRYGSSGFGLIHQTEYPLFLCDVVAILLAVALWRKSQRLTEVGYAWAMAGTVQGLITPVLRYDFPAIEYFSFFVQHGAVPVAAVLLVWGMGLKPEPGAYKRIWFWTFGYFIVTVSFNWILGTNYGFLNAKPPLPTAFDLLGPYPWYLISLHVIAAVTFWLLLLPFKKVKFDELSQN